MSNRKPGFYWVKYRDHWEIGEFEKSDGWSLTGRDTQYNDCELDEIDERRIERPADPERVFYEHKPER